MWYVLNYFKRLHTCLLLYGCLSSSCLLHSAGKLVSVLFSKRMSFIFCFLKGWQLLLLINQWRNSSIAEIRHSPSPLSQVFVLPLWNSVTHWQILIFVLGFMISSSAPSSYNLPVSSMSTWIWHSVFLVLTLIFYLIDTHHAKLSLGCLRAAPYTSSTSLV